MQSKGQVLRHASRCHGAQVYMQSNYVGNKHRHVWLSRIPDPESSLASRPARSSGWQVGLVGYLVRRLIGWPVGWLLLSCCWFDPLGGCLFSWLVWLLGCFVVWLAGWLVDGLVGYLVKRWWSRGRCVLVVGWLGWLAACFGWLAWLNPPTPGPKPRGPE